MQHHDYPHGEEEDADLWHLQAQLEQQQYEFAQQKQQQYEAWLAAMHDLHRNTAS